MNRIAHIINPFNAEGHPDLEIAQPITFESMLHAKNKAAALGVEVELLTAQFEEDLSIIPEGFRPTKNIHQSTASVTSHNLPRKLPFIADILERLYQESSAEYLVYTNVDIGLYPDFYIKVNSFINQGHDAFIINRRRIPAKFTSPHQLQEIFKSPSKSHPGFDCFVIHRSLIPKFTLAQIAIGIPFIGIGMAQNVFCFAQNPKVFEKEFLTFHIGMEIFRKRASQPYFLFNRNEFRKAMHPIMDQMDSRKWPYGNKSFLERMIRWGINPSLPIKLALRLEARRWL